MKIQLLSLWVVLMLLLAACGTNDDDLIFDKTADERVAEAIAALESQLTAPANGWVLRYQPVDESGAYVVLLNFTEDGELRIRTDFKVGDEEFYDQTITYRVDNSLGLELIFENYSFFSFLFEQDNASFQAEYEFDYINETPNGELVFRSKTDLGSPTTLVFEQAPENAESLLGRQVNENLDVLSEGLGVVSPVYRLNYLNRDLSLFLSLNTALRTLSFTYASSASGGGGQSINFSTGYIMEGNTMILGEPFTGTYIGNNITIPAISFNTLSDAASIEACTRTFEIQQYTGTVAESNDAVALLPTLFDPAGASFENISNIFIASVGSIYNNGESVGAQIAEDIDGASIFVLYYLNTNQQNFLSMGYLINLPDNNFTIPVKEFTPTYDGNQVQFDFMPEYTFANGDTTVTLDTAAMNMYINNLTQGGGTRILQSGESTYEFYNPCTGWSVLLEALN
uniref:DUF4302 domain-containing protein n=1 Tax=Roseihalotalea indica TaxID=2867963 RepID=A0AA49GN99_9BACT|nr:DUF4302 domain-containing protein [Tunicatimonas sp. TK19036]